MSENQFIIVNNLIKCRKCGVSKSFSQEITQQDATEWTAKHADCGNGFTKGDWEYSDTTGLVEANGVDVARVAGELDECDANGRLIAAAPDLLAACEDLLDLIEYGIGDERDGSSPFQGGEDQERLAKCRTAIAKARGEK